MLMKRSVCLGGMYCSGTIPHLSNFVCVLLLYAIRLVGWLKHCSLSLSGIQPNSLFTITMPNPEAQQFVHYQHAKP